MEKIILKAPFNSLSLGNVSYNIARELYKKGISTSIFPKGNNFEFDAFDKLDEDFKKWLESSTNNRFLTIEKDTPCLSIWHINDSQDSIGRKSYLYTFYELNSPTDTEKNICKLHEKTIFSSSHASDCFENSSHAPLGFDEDFGKTNKSYLKDKIHFGLIGKWEKRKNTDKIIKYWAEKYGNNNNYQLTCCVINPFFKTEEMNALIANTLENKHYSNINFLPRLKTNSEINELLNSIDIDLSGLSGGEGWNLPSFNSTCLGKWSIVMNHTAHKDWANEENSILVNPSSEVDSEDGVFFQKNSSYNQGTFYSISKDEIISLFEKSESHKDKPNVEGEKLKEKFTYQNTLDCILNIMKE
jgi:hypothetical protein